MDNEIIIIRSTGLANKPIILKPQSEVHFLEVFWDVGRRSIPQWKGSVEDVSAKGLGSRQVRAQALVLAAVVASATMRVVAAAGPLPHVAAGTPAGIEGVAHITVAAETLVHRDRGAWPTASLRLVD